MAGNRVCKIIVCNGENTIICGPAWWMNEVTSGSSGAWLHCLLGNRPFARLQDPNTGVIFTMEKPRTMIAKNAMEGQTVPDPGPNPEDKNFFEKYWLLLLAAGIVAYFYFKK